ncbi:MAG: HAMP domain-containing histidine kinase [Xanthomonadales bacterium]|nr:HAMP domain-containing histidine kinase [Xanthomonadales bacterium]
MKSLFAKLSIALFLVVALLGGGFFVIERYSTQNYYEEITQRLNASIAMYVTGERQLMENFVVNESALALLAQQAMVINPAVEVFLLDTEGNILAHPFPPDSIVRNRVDLTPVRALIEGNVDMPLRGTDPRNLQREKIFSAFPVKHDDVLQGYLYAVLGGAQYDELANSIRDSYVQRLSAGALLAVVLAAFIIGLLVFWLFTRRLSQLTTNVNAFTDSGFGENTDRPGPGMPVASPARKPGTANSGADEIGQLEFAFNAMASKLSEQFENLRNTDRLRRELVSNVSHDLRTPLASMHGYVETLLIKNEELSPDKRREYLEITRKHTLRLGELIGDLFELSKLDSASIHPSLEEFSLAELMHDIVHEYELDASERGIKLGIEAPNDPGIVYADIGLVQRVLENLIRNSLKFTPAGGRINIRLDKKPGAVAVAVEDTGCGIPEQELEHVFNRFYQAENSTRRTANSAGLGLAIVRKILDLHGSRITVSSRVDQGTCFKFDLPTSAAA